MLKPTTAEKLYKMQSPFDAFRRADRIFVTRRNVEHGVRFWFEDGSEITFLGIDRQILRGDMQQVMHG